MPNKVLVTEYIHPAGLELLTSECEVVRPAGTSVAALKEAIADVDGVLVRLAPLPREVIEAGSRLRVIGNHGVGTDNIDIQAATERGIAVCNTPEANSEAVASLAVALMLALSRRLLECDAFVRAGRWAGKEELQCNDFFGSSLAIVGIGRIGTRVAQKCRVAFDMKVFAYDPFLSAEVVAARGATKVDNLDELVARGDFVSMHVPLTPITRGMIGVRQLDLMKPAAFLVNTARGSVVDEPALIDALRLGKIAGAGLDVYEQEPPGADNPLLKMDNVMLVPHLGAATAESMRSMATHAAAEILAVFRGDRPKYLLNPAVMS